MPLRNCDQKPPLLGCASVVDPQLMDEDIGVGALTIEDYYVHPKQLTQISDRWVCFCAQSACQNMWHAIKQRDPAAADAAPKHGRTWTDAENQALLAAGKGKSGTCTDAFWESACAACPILAKRGPVRACRMLCT